jgi:hypothetical protein
MFVKFLLQEQQLMFQGIVMQEQFLAAHIMVHFRQIAYCR